MAMVIKGQRKIGCSGEEARFVHLTSSRGMGKVRMGLSAVSSNSLQIEVVGDPELICILRGLLLSTCWWKSFCLPTVTAPLVT